MTSISIRVDGPDQAGEARRAATALAAEIRLDETTAGRLAIIAVECANNLWKHGGGGEIVLTPIDPHDPGAEVLSLDKGPGMHDVERCFQDGYSTAGSSGTGLGAVRRLATEYDLYTAPGKGTALLARVKKRGNGNHQTAAHAVRGISVPMKGETLCGDDFEAVDKNGATAILLVDGLGHGPAAADCAAAAVEAFRESRSDLPPDVMREVHGALRATRGAAVVIGRFDWGLGELRFSGIGNIAGFIWDGGAARHLLSHPGIVGHDLRNVRELTYKVSESVLVVLYSDGISTHWSLESYAGLSSRDPALIAGVIYRDHKRGRDDATVMVVRGRSRPA
jgi:anti-sigma regulatory factor (Ser/Thr protein kinase)